MMLTDTISFEQARPIWLQGKTLEKNHGIIAQAVLDSAATDIRIKIATSGLYRLYVNGDFVSYGPARAAHGYFRIDDLQYPATEGASQFIVAIECVGFNTTSFYVPDQPSFLQCEIIQGNEVTHSTGDNIQLQTMSHREQKIQRYSFQRMYAELNRLSEGWDAYKHEALSDSAAIEIVEDKTFLPRRLQETGFPLLHPLPQMKFFKRQRSATPLENYEDRCMTVISETYKGYHLDEISDVFTNELSQWPNVELDEAVAVVDLDDKPQLQQGDCRQYRFPYNTSGFIRTQIHCETQTTLALSWGEVLDDKQQVDWTRDNTCNAVYLELEPGTYDWESFEAYTLQYCEALIIKGSARVSDLHVREYINADTNEFTVNDEVLDPIATAALHTYEQNAVDIFMDCPSRERAGWLCDSFWTARVAHLLSGHCDLEKNFLENFLLAPQNGLPEGMLPMCYPGDFHDNNFIPNWAMWLVVQLEEYLNRSGDRTLVDNFKVKLYKLWDYFKGFENEWGLLEKLDRWVFVEWSKANDFVQDVNMPSNMLYAKMLDCISTLYEDPSAAKKADELRVCIREKAGQGLFFIDNAVRENDVLQMTENYTEVCQYFAFFTGTATIETHAQLWETLTVDFGPQRYESQAHPQVHMANAFIGQFMRLELLFNAGLEEQCLRECSGYFAKMADITGTLWEHDQTSCSCNHGFASHVLLWFHRAGKLELAPAALMAG